MDGSMVEFSSNDKTAQGYLSGASEQGPGIIVIQEWWGLVDHIKRVADWFAEEGFVALAPDLYHGVSTESPDEAGKLMMALNIAQTENDLRGAVEYLLNHSSTTGDKVGVVGFCMGGQLALFAASKNPRIGACVDFYGIHPNVTLDFASIQSPVLGLFAEKDSFVNQEAVTSLEANLKGAGVDTDFHTYPGVDHAFFNEDRPEIYNPDAANDAWGRVMAFFGKHLKGGA